MKGACQEMHLSVFVCQLLPPYLLILLSITLFEHLYVFCLQQVLESLVLTVPLPFFLLLLFVLLLALSGSQLDLVEHSIYNHIVQKIRE